MRQKQHNRLCISAPSPICDGGKGVLTLLLLILLPFALFAQQPYRVERLSERINTSGSETGAVKVGDTILAYSTMPRMEAERKMFNYDNAKMSLMQARISRLGKLAKPRPCRWGLNSKKDHTGNLCIDPVNGDLYFTRARYGDNEPRCEIWMARKQRRGWEKAEKLQGDINDAQYTSTHPAVGRLSDGSTILYYASNRSDGMGGMDIWYTILKEGKASQSVNLGPAVNSEHNELTPFYDQLAGVLYFSSDRPGGMGGYDIYCAVGQRNTWQSAEHTCECLNSEWNDLYFTITEHDSLLGMPTMGFLSSNRPIPTDSSACCNDLYSWQLDSLWLAEDSSAVEKHKTDSALVSTDEQEVTSPHFMFPLFLYFHNDTPDPGSLSPTTTTSYSDCQKQYLSLREVYIGHQPNGDDSTMMALFFDTCVDGNYRRVEALFDYIEAQLDDGHKSILTIAGYASPLHRSDYNQTLSERRIASFINMIRAWRGGLFADAIDDGRLVIEQRPHGAVEPTTESNSRDPIYGLPAVLARRIEIISYRTE